MRLSLISTFMCVLFLGDISASADSTAFKLFLEEFEEYSGNSALVMDSSIVRGERLYHEKKYGEAVLLLEYGHDLAGQVDHPKLPGELHFWIGRSYFKISNFADALLNLYAYLDENPEMTSEQRSRCLGLMSLSYHSLSDYDQAFDYRIESLSLRTEANDSLGMARDLYNLGKILYYLNEHSRAEDYYQRSLEISIALENKFTVFSGTSALGSNYHAMGDYEKSLRYNRRSLELAKAINYDMGSGYALHNISMNYYETGYFDSIPNLTEQSINLRLNDNDDWGICGSWILRGRALVKLKDYQNAGESLGNAMVLAEKIKSKTRVLEVQDAYAELYEAMNKPSLAIRSLKEAADLREEIRNENSLLRMQSTELKFNLEKDKEIRLLKKEQGLRKTLLQVFIGVSVILVLFLASLFFLIRRLRKSNDALNEKNAVIAEQNVLLERSNNELEQFAYVASHDMREPIRTIHSFTNLFKRRYSAQMDAHANEFMDFISNASLRMDKMLMDLLDYSRVSSRERVPVSFNMGEAVEIAVKNLGYKIKEENVDVNYGAFPEVVADKGQIIRLLQNLIGNGIKYNEKEKKNINISYSQNGVKYVFEVKDNGIGIEKEHQAEIFEIFRRLHGQKDYEGSGIGLATCKKIVENNGGEIWLESSVGEGTTMYFSLPFDSKN